MYGLAELAGTLVFEYPIQSAFDFLRTATGQYALRDLVCGIRMHVCTVYMRYDGAIGCPVET